MKDSGEHCDKVEVSVLVTETSQQNPAANHAVLNQCSPELVRGGCGRSAHEIEDSANVITTAFVILILAMGMIMLTTGCTPE